jgi:hypothetical protein
MVMNTIISIPFDSGCGVGDWVEERYWSRDRRRRGSIRVNIKAKVREMPLSKNLERKVLRIAAITLFGVANGREL